MKEISLVVPMYNEEEMIPLFFEEVNKVLNELVDYKFEIVCVNDGSKDKTLSLLKEIRKQQTNIHIVSFSRNFGHESAVAAGIKSARGDALIVMDADLQDPPKLIPELIKKWEEGYQVVNAKRVDRKKDSWMKRNTASAFYKVISKLSGKTKIPENVGNYRLLDRVVADQVNLLKEKNRVFRVMVPYIGYKVIDVEFKREERPKGKTHYNYKSMFTLAGNSITSASIVPLKWSFKLGIFLSCLFFLLTVADITLWIINHFVDWPLNELPYGTMAIIFCMFLCLGILLFFIGILCEYVGRIMIETQDRPIYYIDENIEAD
ncbi:MAG: glycosyltransferase family 2 protein [Bacilli bacterium]